MIRILLWSILLAAGLSACAGGGSSGSVEPRAAEAAYVRGDYATALRDWTLRATAGDPEAQYGLGYMYRNGQGVPQNYDEAAKWYGKAAAQGYAKAQVKMGLMYAKGHGVQRSYVQAHKWFNLASVRGEKIAAKLRDKVAADMTPAQIEEAQQLAREWRPAKRKG